MLLSSVTWVFCRIFHPKTDLKGKIIRKVLIVFLKYLIIFYFKDKIKVSGNNQIKTYIILYTTNQFEIRLPEAT